jgi:hypothetical protein
MNQFRIRLVNRLLGRTGLIAACLLLIPTTLFADDTPVITEGPLPVAVVDTIPVTLDTGKAETCRHGQLQLLFSGPAQSRSVPEPQRRSQHHPYIECSPSQHWRPDARGGGHARKTRLPG